MNARIKFRKFGVMKYVGHLDMMRFFQRAIRRVDIPIAYSEGFSPHMIMSFAAPLGIGLTSDAEYFDISLVEGGEASFDEADWINKLNMIMPEGIEVIRIALLEDKAVSGMAAVSAADYIIRMTGDRPESKSRLDKVSFYKWDDFIKQNEINVIKKGKKGDREIDIKPMLLETVHLFDDEGDRIFMRVAQGSAGNLKPDLVMEAYCDYCGVEYSFAKYSFHRVEVYMNDAAKGDQIPLIPYNEN